MAYVVRNCGRLACVTSDLRLPSQPQGVPMHEQF